MNIGIAISTRNRRQMATHTIEQWRKYLPDDAQLFIVDDASDIPYSGADFRFETQAGIAVVKNKCLRLLENFNHKFLVDDDIYPLTPDWWQGYVYSRFDHACYIFDRIKLWDQPDYISYHLPRGCFLYFTHYCVSMAGGFDEKFKIYGYDHAELSRRIFNMHLTPAAYIDVPGSQEWFYSHDEKLTTLSSLQPAERVKHIRVNKILFDQTKSSNQFIPYK